MTEAEWLVCADPRIMLTFLRGKASSDNVRNRPACARCQNVLIGPRTHKDVGPPLALFVGKMGLLWPCLFRKCIPFLLC
jgi:hypothetical protein